MTIKTTVEAFDSAQAQGFRYVGAPDVAVVSVVAERDAPATSLKDLLQACVAVLMPRLEVWRRLLPRYQAYVLVSTPRSLQANALARRRGVWGWPEMQWLPASARRSPSVEIVDASGVRFLGLSEVPPPATMAAAEFVRTHHSSFFFLSDDGDLSKESAQAMFLLAFPKRNDVVDWASLTESLSKRRWILFRVQGEFDDREVSVDALLPTDLRHAIDP